MIAMCSFVGKRSGPVAGSVLLAVLGLGLTGCQGGLHRKGEHGLQVYGAYGQPFDKSGRGETASATVGYNYHFQDRWAFQAQVTPYRNYNLPEGDATAGEWQIGLRWYFVDFDLGKLPVGLYSELLAGMMHASRSVPEDGAHTNFVEDIGLGVELQLAERVSWITGARLRHLSHAHVFGGEPNPGQDDWLVYTGLQFSFR